jgi:DNA-binding GntR family transcriptional regulator
MTTSAAVPNTSRPRRPVRPSTLADTVLQGLRTALIRGDLQPGDRIRAGLIAAEHDVSVIPVREALRVLLAEGRLQYEPHRGYRVTFLSGDQIRELFLICSLLEREALRKGVPAMGQAADMRMVQLLGELEEAPPLADEAALWPLVAAHQDFHFVPMEHAGLPRLVAELRRMWDHTDHYCTLYVFSDEALYQPMNAEHRSIYDACLRRDADAVVAFNDRHREHVLARLGLA